MLAFTALCVLLGAGYLLRIRLKILRNLYLPSCVVGGLLGLVVVQTLGGVAAILGPELESAASDEVAVIPGEEASISRDEVVPNWRESAGARLREVVESWTLLWSSLPGLLINVVFACLFLGVKVPKASVIVRRAGRQLAYGQIVAWGQYVIPLGLWLLFLGRIFPSLPSMFPCILPVGFEGGHGTAAGMEETFAHYGWSQGKDYGLTSATFGILSAIVVGMALVNWAVRKGHAVCRQSPGEIPEDDSIGIIPVDQRPSAGKLSVKTDVIETFSLHIVIVGLAVGLGFLAKAGLVLIENQIPYFAQKKLLSGIPTFPLCLFGGLLIQLLADKFDPHDHIDVGITHRIQNASLDFLVVAAIATIRAKVVWAGLLPLLILVVIGILWNVFCVMVLARRVFKDSWFERAIAEMGQSMGVTATGLLLLRVVDPDYETEAADAFACKQLAHEPIMGGGVWTAMAIPLIVIYGPFRVFLVATTVMTIWLAVLFIPRLAGRR